MKKIYVFAVSLILLAGMVTAYGGQWAKEGKEAFGIKLAEKLGLTADATPEQIQAALDARRQTQKAAMDVKREEQTAKMAEVQAALAAGDYEAWVKAVGDAPGAQYILEQVTEENFSAYAAAITKMHEAKAELEELGITQGRKGKFGHGQRGQGSGLRGQGSESKGEGFGSRGLGQRGGCGA